MRAFHLLPLIHAQRRKKTFPIVFAFDFSMPNHYNKQYDRLERGKVTLYPHDPAWNTEAARTIQVLKKILGDIPTEIEHVGSTAIPKI